MISEQCYLLPSVRHCGFVLFCFNNLYIHFLHPGSPLPPILMPPPQVPPQISLSLFWEGKPLSWVPTCPRTSSPSRTKCSPTEAWPVSRARGGGSSGKQHQIQPLLQLLGDPHEPKQCVLCDFLLAQQYSGNSIPWWELVAGKRQDCYTNELTATELCLYKIKASQHSTMEEEGAHKVTDGCQGDWKSIFF